MCKGLMVYLRLENLLMPVPGGDQKAKRIQERTDWTQGNGADGSHIVHNQN